jgi:multidrug efflux pump subunit AcrA (membrane-fusion protein)
MTRRQLYIIAGAAFFTGAIMLSRTLGGAQGKPDLTQKAVPPRTLQTYRAEPKSLVPEVEFTGPLKARHQIALFAEVSGVMLPAGKAFREGVTYAKGEVIFALDDREAKLSLLSAKAAFKNLLTQIMPDLQLDYPEAFGVWKKYLDQMDIQKPLAEPPSGNPEKLEFFLSSRNIWQQFYAIQAQEVRLTKFAVTAPFDGIVTATQVLPGTLVRANNPVGEFTGIGAFEMEASFDRRDVRFVRQGMRVTLRDESGAGNLSGVVKRIGGKIDERTQTVKVFIEVNHPGLIDGMFLSGTILADPVRDALEIPRSLIQNGDYVYTVTDSLLTRRKIDLIHVSGERAMVRGFKSNELIVAQKLTETPQGIRVKSVEVGAL